MILALLLSAPARAAAPAAVKISSATVAVKVSTGPASEASDPSLIYTAERLRDPFRPLTAAAGSVATHAFTFDDFNIHNLSLHGMMKDRRQDYALFGDPAFGVTFVLRGGRLYDSKGKPVAGVTGALDIKRKTARLMTRDGDVQVFRLGEEGAQ